MAKAPDNDPDFNPSATRRGILPPPGKTAKRPKDQPHALEPVEDDERPDWPPSMPLATNAPAGAPDPEPPPVDHALLARNAAFEGRPFTNHGQNLEEEPDHAET